MRRNKSFILFSIVFFILIFTLENINGRFWLNDFKVYYLAAKSLLEGKQVYGTAFGLGTGFYKYSPFILITFTPYCLFSFPVASIIHFAVIAISCITAILVIQNIMNKYLFNSADQKQNMLLSITIFCILRHIVRELHMGNVNMILVLLLSLGLLFTLKSKYVLSGICIGIAIMIKPYFLLLMLPLLLHKKIKAIYSTVLTLLFSVGITLLVLGFSKGLSLHQSWIQAMLEHNSYTTSNETLQSLIKYYIYPNVPNSFQYYGIAIALLSYLSFFIYTKAIERKAPVKEEYDRLNLIAGYVTLLAIIPNLLLTDSEHFLFSLPLILLLLNYLSITRNYFAIGAFIVLIFFYAWNSPDILGDTLSDKLDEMGMLGISNLLMIGFGIYITIKQRKESQIIHKNIYPQTR